MTKELITVILNKLLTSNIMHKKEKNVKIILYPGSLKIKHGKRLTNIQNIVLPDSNLIFSLFKYITVKIIAKLITKLFIHFTTSKDTFLQLLSFTSCYQIS